MRFITTSLTALAVALAITGCSGGSSNASDNSATATTAPADNSAAMSSDNSAASSDTSAASTNSAATSGDTMGGAASSGGDIPSYPGAKTEAAGSNAMSGSGMASGKVLTTTDSFDKVYAWYQKNLPAGSEKSHTDAPVKTAAFIIGADSKDQKTVSITTNGGKTMITIAHVKT